MAYTKKYLDYLKSNKWQEKRERKLNQIDRECKKINDGGCKGSLQVHHLHYDNLGEENLWDLIVLCEVHHVIADDERRFNTWAAKKFGADFDDSLDDPLGIWDTWESRDLEFENDYNEDDIIYN